MSLLCSLRLTRWHLPDEECDNIVKLRFVKDRYSAYTELSATVILDSPVSDVVGIKFTLGSYALHYGPPDYIRSERRHGRVTVTFRSRGWSAALTQNEPVPGMNYNLDLRGLAAANVYLPFVSYEDNTQQVNYIYVKEHTTMWDAVSAYAMKAYSVQPFIIGHNTVSVKIPAGTPRVYLPGSVISAGELCDRRGQLSKVYMADADGQYTYSAVNPLVADRDIVRERYYELDRQWLSSPVLGLEQKIAVSNRHSSMYYIRVEGYRGEEIFDTVIAAAQGVSLNAKICGFEILLEKNRIETVLYTGS